METDFVCPLTKHCSDLLVLKDKALNLSLVSITKPLTLSKEDEDGCELLEVPIFQYSADG